MSSKRLTKRGQTVTKDEPQASEDKIANRDEDVVVQDNDDKS